jgi:hypothetical protein
LLCGDHIKLFFLCPFTRTPTPDSEAHPRFDSIAGHRKNISQNGSTQ